ncbi:MAG: histidine kinase [Peptococcaceae bacterium BICA1-7]|nr:MAG: histidine kinase [Peptococcaceae bacterium BICA1-7]HBV96996.1 histidine kinase [Desulfotomaculum sp.]
METDKYKLIENLTGVNSSKLNYYVELKQRNAEIIKQNNRLEIIHQIIRDINIDMTLEDIIGRVHGKLPLVIPCDFLGIALFMGRSLVYTAMVPACDCTGQNVPRSSLIWKVFRIGESRIYHFKGPDDGVAKFCSPVRQLGLTSLVLDPLLVKGEAIGVLITGSVQESAYCQQDLKFTRQLADQLAICIENARLYEKVVQGQREWEETFRALTDPIFLIDLNFNIIRFNDRMDGHENSSCKKGFKGKCHQLLWGREKKCANCLLEEVYKTGSPAYRRVQRPSGRVLDVFYYPVLNQNNEIYAVIHHIKDITEQVKMEAQLVQSAKLAAIGEMAAGVAHELNSPMTVVIGNAQMLLREGGLTGSPEGLLNDVVSCGLRCRKIIQNLLTFSRQDHQPLEPTSLNAVVERVLSLIQYQINRNNIGIRLSLDPDLPCVSANGHQLDQVLLNFLLNARDALEGLDRDRLIVISTSVSTGEDGQRWVTTSVEDNGAGIPPEYMSRIFNPFFTSKDASRGTGLGLSVSLGIAQAHGGTIDVSSSQGEGSVFSLALPLDPEGEEEV